MILDLPWYFLPLCLLAGVAYAAVMYFVGKSAFNRSTRWLLATLRCLAVSAIAFMLLAPMTRHTIHERQQPLVALVQDCSESVAASADSTFTFQPLHDKLQGRFRVQTMADTTNRQTTDIGALLEAPLGADAIVLATDGIYNRGQNPATVAERLGIPVYTIALGDTTTRRDAALAHLRVNRIAYLNSEITAEITVNASHLKGKSSTLTISGGAPRGVLSRTPITYTDEHFSTTYTLQIKVGDKPGMQGFVLSLAEANGGEETLINNTLTFYVDIIDNRHKVAIVGAAPHPDLGTIKQALANSQQYETTVMLATDIASGKHRDLGDYSLAILHNLPSATLPVPDALKDLPHIYIIGLQTDLGRFNAMKTGLSIDTRTRKSSDYTAEPNHAFSLFTLDAATADAIALLPPLQAPFGEARTSEGLQSLFTARLGSIDTRQPLLAATAQGGTRRAFIWGEGLWRWRLNDYLNNQTHLHFDQLATQLVNFTALQAERNRLHVEAERLYAERQNVTLQAQAYNEAYEPVNNVELKFTLTDGDGHSTEHLFGRQGDGYALNLGMLPAGAYRYRASATLDGTTHTDEGAFAVEDLNLEMTSLTANHSLLRTISALTGGRMVYPYEMDQLHDELDNIKPVIYTRTRHSELTSLPLVLILLLLLLAAEWVLRKYHGEV